MGTSLVIAGLEASLRQQPDLTVQQIPTPSLGEQGAWNEIKPDLVIIDLATFPAAYTLALLQNYPGLPLVGVNATDDSTLLLYSRRQTTATSSDLAQMIQELALGG